MAGKRWITIAAAALLIAAAVILALYQKGYILPRWIRWQTTEIVCEAERGEPQRVTLNNKTVRVYHENAVVWQSGSDIPVQDILWADIDHDMQKELLLLCWRKGKYGASRPFWVTKDETNWSQHIFIYEWSEEEIRPSWMASDIGLLADRWEFDEIRRLVITNTAEEKSAWDWISWGLQRIELKSESLHQLTFAALGDNLIHKQIYDYAFHHFNGCFDDLFSGVQQELSAYDVTSINQETILVDNPKQYSSYPLFGTPLQVGDAVVNAGFSIVSCATNHTLDQGFEAVDLTVSLYENAGVVCAGAQASDDDTYRPFEILEKNGIRCAVFGYTQSTNGSRIPQDSPYAVHTLDQEQQVRNDLLAGRQAADFCIVYVHWGTEYASEPDEEQRRWAEIFAECGVDVVIGTHPHVLQPYEWVSGTDGHQTLVYYSLGNFISAQTDESCKIGGMAYFTVTKVNESVSVTDVGLKTLITEVSNGHYSTKFR